jgi:HNH endonuclease
MKALEIAAAAAISFAPFSVVATTPGVAQAAPFAGAGADSEGCQWSPFLVAQYRISMRPALTAPAPTSVTPVQTPQLVASSPLSPSTIPAKDADEELTRPWWPLALRYGLLMMVVSLIAWTVGLYSHRAVGTAPIPPRPEPRRAGRGALAVRSALTFPTIDHPGAEVIRMVLAEAGHRCAIPTCRKPTTEIAHIVAESQSHDSSFENLIALCPACQKKEIDRQSMRMYKRNLGILNSRYSDFERRVFDQIAETDRRSFVVEAGSDIRLLHAVNDGLLKRVELSLVAIQRGEPTHYKYEVADAGLDFVSRYIQGEDVS